MKTIIYLIIGFYAINTSIDPNHELIVNINNIEEKKGEIFIALYDSDKSFGYTDSVFLEKIIPVKSHSVTTTFRNLPKGQYAISVFHDVNMNGQLDKNLLVIPIERYGFSRNPKILFKAPSFLDCVFEIEANKTIEIRLN